MADTIIRQKDFSNWDFRSNEFWVQHNGKSDLCSILVVCGGLFTEDELKTLRDYGKRLTERTLTLVKQIYGQNYIFVSREECGYLYRRHTHRGNTPLDSFEKLTGILDDILQVEK